MVRRLFEEGWGQGDLQVVDEVVPTMSSSTAPPRRPSVSAHDFTTPGPVAYAETIQVLRTDFPDLRVTIEDVVADGDMVAMRTTFAGTQADPIEGFGVPNTGRPMAREVWVFARWSAARWPRCGFWSTT